METTTKETSSMHKLMEKVNIVKGISPTLDSSKIIWLMDKGSKKDNIMNLKAYLMMVRKKVVNFHGLSQIKPMNTMDNLWIIFFRAKVF